MFDIEPNEIALLSDESLRLLVARLCEAELAMQNTPTSGVTYGGDQNARDGGLDVRVVTSPPAAKSDFIPRHSCGFQVKVSDLRPAAIMQEIRPKGEARESIRDLAVAGGAYIIVSSRASLSDSSLSKRRQAMRKAVEDVADEKNLYIDFYDRTRIAAWARKHPGIIAWIKEQVGSPFTAWRSFGCWSNPSGTVEDAFLVDDYQPVRFRGSVMSVTEAIETIRDVLHKPRKFVRIVGLSGTGKTRFAQALFDSRIGQRALAPASVVYANLSDSPSPSPLALGIEMIAKRSRSVLVVDNCPRGLHRRLVETCVTEQSTVSVLTIEHDIADDQPENTDVFQLSAASSPTIYRLLKLRFPALSTSNVERIVETSDGNYRIAVAIAGTLESTGSVAQLRDEELFRRLFYQTNEHDESLLLSAQVFALTYSFDGETISGDDADIVKLAALVEQSPSTARRNLAELERRDLVQSRSRWRALLPHAMANRLAANALQNISYEAIGDAILRPPLGRLAKSFARRLSFLHLVPQAQAVARLWLSVGGLLHDIADLDDVGSSMLKCIAPVAPTLVLAALERVWRESAESMTPSVLASHLETLQWIAYEPALFESAAGLMFIIATSESTEAARAKSCLRRLFSPESSGTHATLQQRLYVVERALLSTRVQDKVFAIELIEAAFQSTYDAETGIPAFGARPRDFGYSADSPETIKHWHETVFLLAENIPVHEEIEQKLAEIVRNNFATMWCEIELFDVLERLMQRFSRNLIWRDGLRECMRVLRHETLKPESRTRLRCLVRLLEPSDRVLEALFVINYDFRCDIHEAGLVDVGSLERATHSAIVRDQSQLETWLKVRAEELGRMTAASPEMLSTLAEDLVMGGAFTSHFAIGLGSAPEGFGEALATLIGWFKRVPEELRNVGVFQGMLAAAWKFDQSLANDFLDFCLTDSDFLPFFSAMQSAIPFDEAGISRLKQAFKFNAVPTQHLGGIGYGCLAGTLTPKDLGELLKAIAQRPDGFAHANAYLCWKLDDLVSRQTPVPRELIEAGRFMLDILPTSGADDDNWGDLNTRNLATVCLADADAEVHSRLLLKARSDQQSLSPCARGLVAAICRFQPRLTLNTLFPQEDGDMHKQRAAAIVRSAMNYFVHNPFDFVPTEVLLDWCSESPDTRFSIAASIVSFCVDDRSNWSPEFSRIACRLFSLAPDPAIVLEVFIDRCVQSELSGEQRYNDGRHARLLDSLASATSRFGIIAREGKVRLLEIAEQMRAAELDAMRNKYQSFE